jgi:hypothetical protein
MLKREIRDAIALDPIATIPQLTERLNKRLKHSFDPRYIKRLRDKVSRQLIVESDRTLIEDRMRQTRENSRTTGSHARGCSSSLAAKAIPRHDDCVEAAKALVMLDLALLKAEIETGMFKKPIEALAREFHYDPLPPEMRMVVIAAWQRGGMLPKATVERMVPALGSNAVSTAGSTSSSQMNSSASRAPFGMSSKSLSLRAGA